MTGTYTSRRTLPYPFDPKGKWESNGVITTPHALGVVAPSQVTTSYRTGSTEKEPAQSDDDRLLAAKSTFALYKSYGRESRGSSRNRPRDTGHPFDTTKQSVSYNTPRAVVRSRYGVNTWIGPLVPDDRYSKADGGRTTFVNPGTFAEGYYGPKAIANTMPTNPVSDLAVTLAELKREGIPSLPGRSSIQDMDRRNPNPVKDVGGEYLNVEFGYLPLASAIADTVDAVSRSAKILRQYQRDSGRIVRRSYTFPVETDVQTWSPTGAPLWNAANAYGWDQGGYPAIGSWGTLHESLRTTRKVWYKGAYTYYLQKGHSVLDQVYRFEERANKLLGLRITPDVLWEVQPWSWLIDWQINIGDNIANASRLANDGLVIVYGYLMCTTETVHTLRLDGVQTGEGQTLPPVIAEYTVTRKQRVRASPFGFGSNPAGYTPRQWAILGALGMTKAPNVLG